MMTNKKFWEGQTEKPQNHRRGSHFFYRRTKLCIFENNLFGSFMFVANEILKFHREREYWTLTSIFLLLRFCPYNRTLIRVKNTLIIFEDLTDFQLVETDFVVQDTQHVENVKTEKQVSTRQGTGESVDHYFSTSLLGWHPIIYCRSYASRMTSALTMK